MISNFFLAKGKPLSNGIEVHRFLVPEFKALKDKSRIYSLARRAGYRLERQFGGFFEVMGADAPEIILYRPTKKPKETKLTFIDGTLTLIPAGKRVISPQNTSIPALERLIQSMISRAFIRMGYEKFKRLHRKPKPQIIYSVDQNPIRFFQDAFIFSTKVFDDGKIGLWIDIKGTIDQPADLFIKHKLQQGYTEEDIRKLMLEKKMNVTLRPGNASGVITDVLFERTAGSFILKDDPKRRTLSQYWKDEYNVTVPKDDVVIMVNRFPFRYSLPYPATCVFLWTRGEQIPFKFMKLLHMSPRTRLTRLQRIVKQLNSQPLRVNGTRITLNEKPIKWTTLIKEKKCLKVGNRRKIQIKMGGKKVSTNAKDVLKYGPFSGKKDINAVLVMPSTLIELSDKFKHVLKKYFRKFGLGEINFIETFEVEKLTPMSYWEKGYEIGRFFDSRKIKNCISIVVLPNKGEKSLEYFEFRRGVGRAKETRSKSTQMILPKTMHEIINEKDQNLIGNFLIQVYLKTLTRGEAVWLLNNPAGNSKYTCYMGYDVARLTERVFDPTSKTWIKERKEAAAYAAVCDSYGRVIECRSLFAQRGEMLTPHDVVRLLYEILHECKTAMREFYGEKFSRLVIYRDGDIKKSDLKMMEVGIENLFENVRDKYPDLVIDVVAVIKTGIERLFKEDWSNPNIGDYVILNDKYALVCTSDIRHKAEYVTARPLKLKYVLSKSIDGKERRSSMEKIVNEIIDLTKLDWASLVHLPRLPLPLILVQQISKLTLRDVSVPKDVPYVPL